MLDFVTASVTRSLSIGDLREGEHELNVGISRQMPLSRTGKGFKKGGDVVIFCFSLVAWLHFELIGVGRLLSVRVQLKVHCSSSICC